MTEEIIKKLEKFYELHTSANSSDFSYYSIQKKDVEIIFLERKSSVDMKRKSFSDREKKNYLLAQPLTKEEFLSKIERKIKGIDKHHLTVHFNNRSTLRSIITTMATTMNDEMLYNAFPIFKFYSQYEKPEDGYNARLASFECIQKTNISQEDKEKLIRIAFSTLNQKTSHIFSPGKSETHSLKEILSIIKENSIIIESEKLNLLQDIKKTLLEHLKDKNIYQSSDSASRENEFWNNFVRSSVDKNIWNKLIDGLNNKKEVAQYIEDDVEDEIVKSLIINVDSLFSKYPLLLSNDRNMFDVYDKFSEHLPEMGLKNISIIYPSKSNDEHTCEFFIKYDKNSKDPYILFKKTLMNFFDLLNEKISSDRTAKIKETIKEIDLSILIKKSYLDNSFDNFKNKNDDQEIQSNHKRMKI